jgi:hypothetical protein
MERTKVSGLERFLAGSLSLVWLMAGCVALYFAVVASRWSVAVLAVVALVYGVAWLRVVLLSRMLTWHELVAPWRRVQGPTK